MGHEDTYFTPEAVDEEIDRLCRDSYLPTSPSPDAQMLQELRALCQSDESRLQHIWARLAAQAQQQEQEITKLPVDIQYYQQRKLQDQLQSGTPTHEHFLMDVPAYDDQRHERKANDDPSPGKPAQKKNTLRRLSLFLSQLVAVLIIGSLLFVPTWMGYQHAASPNQVHQTQQDIISHSVYLSNEQGVMGVNTTNGHGRWTYTIPNYALGLPANPIVDNNTVYTESQDSVYAINAMTGASRWLHTFPSQLSPYQTTKSRLVLAKNAIYVPVVFMEVDKLDATNGKLLQTYRPRLNTNIVSIAVENDALYVFGRFDMCALRLSDGKQLWHQQNLDQSQVLGVPHVVNGTFYTIASSDVNWPYADPASTSHIEAFEAGSGNLLWQSTPIKGSVTDISINNGIIYDGSTNGSVSAYDMKTGGTLWSTTISGISFSGNIAPLVDTDTIYMLANDPTLSYQSVGIIALDAVNGRIKWQYPGDGTLMKHMGGHLFNPPVVQNGVVFVNDSISGSYALISGAVLWHRPIDNNS